MYKFMYMYLYVDSIDVYYVYIMVIFFEIVSFVVL